jgi:hypothetical protein
MRFGEFLVKNGAITEEVLPEALYRQQELELPLVKIALDMGILSPIEISEILHLQLTSDLLFEDIVLALHGEKSEKVKSLLQEQYTLRPPIGEILLEMQKINKETLTHSLKMFHSSVATN